jgi:hypothetical protein
MAGRRRASALAALLAGFLAALLLASTASAAGPSLAPVIAALRQSPVFVDPAAGAAPIDAARLRSVVPKNTYFAALPPADVAATADKGVPADPAALPALLSSQLGGGGTVIVLVAGKLYGASTTIPGSLGDAIATAQAALPSSGDATGALVALMRSLSGSGTLSDVPSPSRAGGPVGPALLIAMAIAVAVGALALWWWLRRPPSARRRKRRRPAPLLDLVEIDHQGNVIRRIPAAERERPSGG